MLVIVMSIFPSWRIDATWQNAGRGEGNLHWISIPSRGGGGNNTLSRLMLQIHIALPTSDLILQHREFMDQNSHITRVA